MNERTLSISYWEFASIGELQPNDILLLEKAREVSLKAWSPYSGFKVGAALQLTNGIVVTGNNQENAAYPSGLCAERVALFSANALYPDQPVTTLAISASNAKGLVSQPIKPCGACCQSLIESETRFKHPIRVLLDGREAILLIQGITSLLPFSFNSSVL